MSNGRYQLEIVIKGTDRASGPLRRTGDLLSRIGYIATGILVAEVLRKLGTAMADMFKGAVNAAAEFQLIEVTLRTLMVRELMQGEEVIQQRQKMVSLTDEEKERLETLRVKRDVLYQQMRTQYEKIRQMREVWQETPAIEVDLGEAKLREMRERLGDMTQEIVRLQNKEGSLTTVQEKLRINQMSYTEAMAKAGFEAQNLMKWLRELSLASPFQVQDVMQMFRLYMAYGLTSEQAKGLTSATLDYAAAMGLSSEQIDRLSYNLAQAVGRGDLTKRNLRDMSRASLDFADILEQELGMNLEQVNTALDNGKLALADLGKAFQSYSEKYFTGAAQRMTKTFIGLKNNIKDLFTFAAVDTLSPMLEIVTEKMNTLFDTARAFLEEGGFQRLGSTLGGVLSTLMEGDFSGALYLLSQAFEDFGAEKTAEVFDALQPFGGMIEELKSHDPEGALRAFAAGVGTLGEKIGLWDHEMAVSLYTDIQEIGNSFGGMFKKWKPEIAAAQIVWMDWWAQNGQDVADAINTIKGSMAEGKDEIPEFSKAFSDFFLGGKLTADEDGMQLKDAVKAVLDTMKGTLEELATLSEGEPAESPLGKIWQAWFDYEPGKERQAKMKEMGAAIADFFAQTEPGTLGTALGKVFDGLASGLETLTGAWEGSKEAWTDFAGTIAGWVQSFRDLVGVWEGSGESMPALVTFFQNLASADLTDQLAVFQPLIDGLAAGMERLAQAWDGFKEGWTDFIWKIFGSPEELQANLEKVLKPFQWLYDELVGESLIPDLVEEAVKILEKLPKDAADAISGNLTELVKVGRNIVESIKQGVIDKWDGFKSWLVDQVTGVIRAIMASLGMGSPSKVFMDIGANMVEGLQLGWAQGMGGLGMGGVGAMVPAGGGGGMVIGGDTYNIHISNPATAAMAMAMFEDRRRERLNAFMGG